MTGHRRNVFVLSVLASGLLAGCEASPPSAPSASQTRPLPNSTDVVFGELGSGFSTSDLRDVNEQIVHVNAGGELVWTADGTRLPGFRVDQQTFGGSSYYWITGNICREGCAFEVRFGTKDGERRAYLTADYGHDNPGTLVDVEIVSGSLVVTRTAVFPPGSPTLSGIVSEVTSAGRTPVVGARVLVGISSGWRDAATDQNGVYRIPGLFRIEGPVRVTREGYQTKDARVFIDGDTNFDISLTRD